MKGKMEKKWITIETREIAITPRPGRLSFSYHWFKGEEAKQKDNGRKIGTAVIPR